MTIESASTFLDELFDVPGLKKARRAINLALPMSGSPMETRMVLPFYLSHRYGGFGLDRPKMNMPLPLDERAWGIAGTDQPFVTGDAVWTLPNRDDCFVMEFQSREYHDSPQAYGADYARALALRSMGHQVVFVTRHQLESVDQVTEIAHLVAAYLGTRAPKYGFRPPAGLEELLSRVLS